MNGWELKCLDSFGELTSSKRIYLSDYVSEGVPFYRSKEIIEKSEGKDISTAFFIDKKKFYEIKDKFGAPSTGDILITAVGTLGVIYRVKENDFFYFKDGNLIWLRKIKKHISSSFLFHLLNSKIGKAWLDETAIGSSQPAYTIANLKKVKFPIPPKSIQNKISAVLSAYDDLIENNKRRIDLLEKMAEEIYCEWFVRMRFPGHEKVTFEKGVAEGWEIGKLGEIINLTMGQSPKSEFYNETGDGLPFNQGVGTYGERFPKRVTFCSVDGRMAKTGDILFSVRAPVGRLNIADCDMIIGRGLAAIRHKKGKNGYLYYFMKVVFSNEDIIGNGAIFNSVGKDELNGFPILKPKDEIIEKFNNVAGNIDKQIALLFEAQERLIKTRNMLLPRLISGKLSVENLEIQFPPSMQDEATS